MKDPTYNPQELVKKTKQPLYTLRRTVPVIIAGILILTTLAQAQNDINFIHYTMEDGLSHNSVYSIVQDKTGFLWIATEDGLDRFDGYSFRSYRYDPLDTHSLPMSNSNILLSGRDGDLWIGTWGGGLARYNTTTDQFIRYGSASNSNTALSDNRIQALCEDHSGNLWIGTYSGGLNRLDRTNGNITCYKNEPGRPHSLSNNRIWSIVEDDKHFLWIGTQNGLCRLSLDSLDQARFLVYENNPDDPASISSNIIRSLYIDHLGSLWIGTQKGLNRKRKDQPAFNRFFIHNAASASLSGNVINCITEDKNNRLWVGVLQGGLNMLDLNHEASGFRRYTHTYSAPSSISNNDVRSVWIDRSLNLWVATRGGGINQADLKPKKFSTVTDFMYFRNERVWAICDYEGPGENNLWLGTDRGLIQMDRIRNVTVLHDTTSAIANSIHNNYIRALHHDDQNILWIGTSGGGINCYNVITKRFSYLVHQPFNSNSLSDNRVRVIYEESDIPEKPLWIGTYGGLNRYDRASGIWRRFQHNPADSLSISQDEIRVIYKDRKGFLWIGTFGGGLNLWDPAKKSFKRFQSQTGRNNWINSNDILCLADDPDTAGHIVWIGTNGQGLNRFDVAGNKFTQITSGDGLPNDVIYGIIPDRAGNLWISTNKGICRFNPAHHTFHNYDHHDGLQSDIFGPGAYHKNRNGIIYFGGLKGLSYFDPSGILNNPFVPPVVLTSLKVFNREIGRFSCAPAQLSLSYEDYFFTLEFAALDFTIPKKNQFAYRLKGFDNDWVYSGNQHYAVYTNVEPGTYAFEVIASNNDQIWNTSGLSIPVIIHPPYWKTWWFRAAIAGLALLSVYMFYRFRMQQISKQKELLEKQVAERTQELADKNNELEFLNEKKNEFMGIAAHDLRNPLNAIIGYTDLMLMQIQDQPYRPEDTIEDLMTVQKSAKQMAQLISELLDISAIESGKLSLELQTENLLTILKECERLHSPAASHKNITLHIDYSTDLPDVLLDRSRIIEVIDNLLSNAIKYTYPNGNISVLSEYNDREVILHVKDTGQGLDDEDMKNIFMSFKRLSSKPTGGEASTGLGLAIVKKIIELHGGRVWVESLKGKGSVFSFSIPRRRHSELPA